MSARRRDDTNEFAVLTPSPYAGDSAVGVPDRQQEGRFWYIIVVKNNTEKACAERVSRLGYDTYVPTQTVIQKNSRGQRKTVERRILPSLIFLHATNEERKRLLKLPYLYKSLDDPSNKDTFGKSKPAYAREDEIERLKFMLYKADYPVSIEPAFFQKGDLVRVMRGSLYGLEGNVVSDTKGTYIVVSLSILGCAKVEVNREDLEIVSSNHS